MDYSRCAKQELRKLRQLYVAQINLRNAQMLIKEAGKEERPPGIQQPCHPLQTACLKSRTEHLNLRMERVLNALCVLAPEEKRILLLCYAVDGFAPEDIMELLHMEKSTFYRKKKAALEKFTEALYGAI